MKMLTTLLLIILLFPYLAFAGTIHGIIGEKSVEEEEEVEVEIESPKQAKVEITCGSSTYKTSTTIPGSYMLDVEETGECKLTVYYNNQSPSIRIRSQSNPVRYDLVLEKSNGSYSLKRQ